MININNIDIIIKEISSKFPDKLPRSSKSDFELGKLVGHQEVIDFLSEMKQRQEIVAKKKAKL